MKYRRSITKACYTDFAHVSKMPWNQWIVVSGWQSAIEKRWSTVTNFSTTDCTLILNNSEDLVFEYRDKIKQKHIELKRMDIERAYGTTSVSDLELIDVASWTVKVVVGYPAEIPTPWNDIKRLTIPECELIIAAASDIVFGHVF